MSEIDALVAENLTMTYLTMNFEVAKKSQSSLNSRMNADSEKNTHFEIMFTIVLNE